MSGAGTAGKVAGKEAEHVIAKAVQKAGVRDAEKVVAKDVETNIFKRAKKLVTRDPYRRPSGYRKGMRDTVWDGGRSADGRVRDPYTGRVMNKTDPWDMGHNPGQEFRKHQQSARERQISRKQFLDEHNNPTHYRPELPSSNRGHRGEDPGDSYLGP